MNQDILNLNEESFVRILDVLSHVSPALKEQYNKSLQAISNLSNEWNDEDFQLFIESLKSVERELDDINEITLQTIDKVNYKLEIISARRNIEL